MFLGRTNNPTSKRREKGATILCRATISSCRGRHRRQGEGSAASHLTMVGASSQEKRDHGREKVGLGGKNNSLEFIIKGVQDTKATRIGRREESLKKRPEVSGGPQFPQPPELWESRSGQTQSICTVGRRFQGREAAESAVTPQDHPPIESFHF